MCGCVYWWGRHLHKKKKKKRLSEKDDFFFLIEAQSIRICVERVYIKVKKRRRKEKKKRRRLTSNTEGKGTKKKNGQSLTPNIKKALIPQNVIEEH